MQVLQGKELYEAKLKEFKRAIKQYRLDVGISSPFQVSKELGTGSDTIYKYEKGHSIPSVSLMSMLIMFYGLDKVQREYITELRKEVLRLRKVWGK